MSKRSQDALAAIERIVFQSNKPIVVALTGGWGEGKTYFWKEVVVPSHADRKSGYVSVFGAESLAVIRERVAIASSRLAELAESGTVPEWMQKISGPVATGIRKAASFWGGKIGVSDSIAVELLQSFGLKPGWIVCIDDIERLSKNVGVENFLGYVTELRDKWKLKVVLIYNKEPIDKDEKSLFHVYQEKVIDRSIPFALDFSDMVSLVFKDVQIPSFDVCIDVQKKSEVLGLRNIRILGRTRSYFDEVVQVVGSGASADFLRASIGSLLLFAYTKFSNQKPETLTFEMLEKHSEWTDRFRKSAGLPAEDEERFDPAKELLERYGYMISDDLDLLLLSFVQSDVLDADKLRAQLAEYMTETNKQTLAQQLRGVWDTQYHGTLRDNPTELCDAIEAALPPNLPHIGPGELDSALAVLDNLGRGENAQRIFDAFKRTRAHIFESLDPDSMPFGPFVYAPFKNFLEGIVEKRASDNRTIEEVMESAFADPLISPKDCDRLATFSIDDLVAYLSTHDRPKLTSRIRTLVRDGTPAVREMTLNAVEKIAASNPLNRIRFQGMGLLRKGVG